MGAYRKGVYKEYCIMDILLKKYKCDIVLRSAGSHSPIDVIGIRKKDKKIWVIQSKSKKMSEKTTKKLQDEFKWLNDEFMCKFRVIKKPKEL